jgi:protein arginine kinase activator
MVCDLCKTNNAVIHIEKHSGDNHTQLRVCCECAGLEGLTPENLNGESLQKLISGLNQLQQDTKEILCLECGMDAASFQSSGKLGCSSCYVHLKSVIDMSIWQKSSHYKHLGKTPYKFDAPVTEAIDMVDDLEILEEKLVISISEENYEEAAILRDRIEEMKKAVT